MWVFLGNTCYNVIRFNTTMPLLCYLCMSWQDFLGRRTRIHALCGRQQSWWHSIQKPRRRTMMVVLISIISIPWSVPICTSGGSHAEETFSVICSSMSPYKVSVTLWERGPQEPLGGLKSLTLLWVDFRWGGGGVTGSKRDMKSDRGRNRGRNVEFEWKRRRERHRGVF